MSQLPRLSRARQLTASVWPGWAADGHGDLVAGRLRKLAAAGSTGTLPFSGACTGAIHLYQGQVVHAESARTPGASTAGLVDGPPLRRLAAILAVTEPTVDAVLDLLSAETRCAKFRPARAPAADPACGIPVEILLAEVTRRQRLLGQLSGVVTADTVIARNPRLSAGHIQVSAWQWALLTRVQPSSTPRTLAWELRRSVFGTTADVYRLLVLRLLSAAGRPASTAGRGAGPAPGHDPGLISFIRAAPASPGRTAAAPASPVPRDAGSRVRAAPEQPPASAAPAEKGGPMTADSSAARTSRGER